MSEPKKDAAPAVSTVSGEVKTDYKVEHAPKLPSLNVSTERPEPVIDQRLIELRNAEAKAQADRLK